MYSVQWGPSRWGWGSVGKLHHLQYRVCFRGRKHRMLQVPKTFICSQKSLQSYSHSEKGSMCCSCKPGLTVDRASASQDHIIWEERFRTLIAEAHPGKPFPCMDFSKWSGFLCTPCPTGSFKDLIGNVGCQICPEGYYSEVGSTSEVTALLLPLKWFKMLFMKLHHHLGRQYLLHILLQSLLPKQ